MKYFLSDTTKHNDRFGTRNPRAVGVAVLAAFCFLASCATSNLRTEPRINIGPFTDEAIRSLADHPFADKALTFKSVEDLSAVTRQLGKPLKTIEQEVPNRYDPGIVDKVTYFEYASFSVTYYFSSYKNTHFPYSVEFTSNENIEPGFRVIGLHTEDLLRAIHPRTPDAYREGYLFFTTRDGTAQIAVLYDQNQTIVGIVVHPYLD